MTMRLLQDRRTLVGLAVLLPAVIYLTLRLAPQLDPTWNSAIFHFYIVTFTSMVAVVSACFIFLVVANQTPEQTFLVLAFISMAGLFTVHGLATPGILFPGPNIAVGWAARLSLTIGAIFSLLSVLEYSQNWRHQLTRYRNLLALLVVVILILLVWLMIAAPPLVVTLVNSASFSLLVSLVTIGLLLGASWLAWQKFQRQGEGLHLVLTLGFLWLASAQVSQYETPLWQFSWWMYHIWMLAAYLLTMVYLVANYERTQEFRLTRYFLTLGVIIGAALTFVQSELAVVLSAQEGLRWTFVALFSMSIALLLIALFTVVYRAQQILDDRTEIIQQEKRWRKDMTNLMAHDLMSPLNAILLDLDLIERQAAVQDTPRNRQRIERIKQSTQAISELLHDMLNLEKLEAGSLQLDLEQTDFTTLLRDGIEQMHSIAEYRQIDMSGKLPPESIPVKVDEKIMRRVIQNLLGNALKFAPEGGQVKLQVAATPETVRVMINDNGPGIPDEKKEVIFHKFGQLRNEDRDLGFGLGLAFCKLAIEEHNGQIWVEDQPGGGSLFIFTLPR